MTTVSNTGPKPNHIAWADVYFTASANHEPFEDVEIVTAKSSYLNLALVAAADIIMKESLSAAPSPVDVSNIATLLMDDRKVFVHEHVKVAPEGISICINAITLDDEDAVWRALDMLADALEHLDGAHGTVYFGTPLHFSSSEISWNTVH